MGNERLLPSPTYHFLFLFSCRRGREHSGRVVRSCSSQTSPWHFIPTCSMCHKMKPINDNRCDKDMKGTSIVLWLYSQSHMNAVQGGVHSLGVGCTHCGKPQSQSACSPQLEEEEDHGKMDQQLYATYSSMQRHGKALEAYSLRLLPL